MDECGAHLRRGIGNVWIARYLCATGAIAVIVLFPGYFIYHWGLYYGVWPPLLGGLYGPASAGFAVLLLPTLVPAFRARGQLLGWSLLVGGLVVYAAAWAVLHFLLGSGYQATSAAALQTGASLLFMVCLFFAGVAAPWGAVRFRRSLTLAAFVAVGLLVWSLLRESGLGFGSPLHETTSAYQGLARSLMVSFLVAVALADARWLKVVGAVVGGIGLFLMAARSEFAGLFIGLVALTLVGKRNVAGRVVIVAALGAMLFGLILFAGTVESGSFARMAELLDLASSSSWQKRQDLTAAALAEVTSSPILGSYGAHQASGTTSGYAHNYLSAYVAFGLAGFLGFSGVLVTAAAVSFRWLRRSDGQPVWALAFSLSVTCVVLAALSKSVFWSLPGLVWGVVAHGLMVSSPHRADEGVVRGSP